jgi:hypothetical protein
MTEVARAERRIIEERMMNKLEMQCTGREEKRRLRRREKRKKSKNEQVLCIPKVFHKVYFGFETKLERTRLGPRGLFARVTPLFGIPGGELYSLFVICFFIFMLDRTK